MFNKIKSFLGSDETRKKEIEQMPTLRRARRFSDPVGECIAEVNSKGQIHIPRSVRVSEIGPTITHGDILSIDVCAPGFFDGGPGKARHKRETFIDVRVTSNNMVTIPSEIRNKLDIREGDTIAVHMYWRNSGDE